VFALHDEIWLVYLRDKILLSTQIV